MKIDTADLRETLERMETGQLDALLREELKKEAPDGPLVRLIGSILQDREKGLTPEIDANMQQAWERYRQDIRKVHSKSCCRGQRLAKAACLILVLLAFLVLLPREVQAKPFFQRFMDWTEDVFSLTNPGENQGRNSEYQFQTDNPGLQEVYDQVTALGVTAPVVPMWLPDGYKLADCIQKSNPTKHSIAVAFVNGESTITYQIDIYSNIVTHDYSKNEAEIGKLEKNGITFTILQNHNLLVAVWTIENIECSIFIDCPEEVLLRILNSIYTTEEP